MKRREFVKGLGMAAGAAGLASLPEIAIGTVWGTRVNGEEAGTGQKSGASGFLTRDGIAAGCIVVPEGAESSSRVLVAARELAMKPLKRQGPKKTASFAAALFLTWERSRRKFRPIWSSISKHKRPGYL